MAVLDDDFSIGATLTEGSAGIWSSPKSTAAASPQDFRALYAQQRARVEATEARCEELRRAEVAARSSAGYWKWHFKSCRRRLSEAEEEAKELRSAARDVPSLRTQVARLQALLSEACARSNEGTLVEALSKEVAGLQDALAASPARRGGAGRQSAGEARRARTALEVAPQRTETNKTLRKAAKSARTGREKAEARLREAVKASRRRIETLEAQLAKLRATGAMLSNRLYGRKSEQQDKPRSERARGQQPGAPGHGRIQRPGFEERHEEIDPPPEACVCAHCGQPYAPNGAEESTLVEIDVKAHKRVFNRPRWRRSCECRSSPVEVTAPPVPRLFPRMPYGISFRARFLFEHCACFRPVRRVAAWFSSHGLAVSAGTLANSRKRFAALFETPHEAILAHQNDAALRHADETSWRVQELRGEERSSRAWLWTSVSADAVCFCIDASRSAEAGLKLFAEARSDTVIVCDRYSAYKRLVRLLGDKMNLSFCWSHARRDSIDCAAGQVRLTQWCQGWIERIAEIFRLNDTRLKHYEPGLELQTPPFDAAQDDLEKAVERLFADAEAELADLSPWLPWSMSEERRRELAAPG